MAVSEDLCAKVVFGETSLLRAPGGDEVELVTARRYIAGVVYARYEGHGNLFAPPLEPTNDQLADASILKHWNLCKAAAKTASGDPMGTCLHYVISWLNAAKDGPAEDDPAIEDPWPTTQKAKITNKFGPFTRVHRDDMYILKYCGVHL